MKLNQRPKVSIGCPVYNGEIYIAQALEAVLAQTFQNYELIISDDASTDRTGAICMAYAQKDKRIRYHKSHKNLGASANFNRVLALSTGDYFKWMAQDDLHEPTFLIKCVEVLDRDPSVVLAFTRAITINHDGKCIRKEWGNEEDLASFAPSIRFKRCLAPPVDPIPLPIFGVVRRDILTLTALFKSYPECDRALLAELSLHGRFYEIPEPLFAQREHPARAGPKLSKDPYGSFYIWKTGKKPMLLPHGQLFLRHVKSVCTSRLEWKEKAKCGKVLTQWFNRHRGLLARDMIHAGERLPWLGGHIQIAYKKHVARSWSRRISLAVQQIGSSICAQTSLILVDEAAFGIDNINDCKIFPFIENNGSYWGPPADDNQAIVELDRLRAKGARYLAFGWPAFWWLDYYREFMNFVHDSFTCILRNDNVVVFDLKTCPEVLDE
jgi:glycosyltransferase involved in cell wall biosynthesis